VQNGLETDVDCGGPNCADCGIGQGCIGNNDCTTGLCVQGVCTQTCADGIKNGYETDVDCGGPACPGCTNGRNCFVDTDCAGLHCEDIGFAEGGICCCPSCDEDRDSLLDCAEYTDGLVATDPALFNGMHGYLLTGSCSGVLPDLGEYCNGQDTVAEIQQCVGALTPRENKPQYSGWTWQSSALGPCDPSHQFSPNWTTGCNQINWAVYYGATLYLEQPGTYCFGVAKKSDNTKSCATVVVGGMLHTENMANAGVCTTIQAPTTVPLEAFYRQENELVAAPGGTFIIGYCHTPTAYTCDPSTALPLPPDMLRPRAVQ
jgi:hypothetical protein